MSDARQAYKIVRVNQKETPRRGSKWRQTSPLVMETYVKRIRQVGNYTKDVQ